MTREGSIKICKQVRKYFKGGKLVTDDTDAICEALTNAIEALSDVPDTNVGKWIPCSEWLPEEGRYLVVRHDDVTKTNFIDILWFEKNVWWNRQFTGNFAVFAWMSLPEPYKEDRS